jgi:hypothetical protein
VLLEELEWVELEALGDSFEGAEGEVAFPAFEAAHVGAVDAELFGEGFLGEASFLSVAAEVGADGALEVALHVADPARLLLDGLQTHE